MIWLGTIIALLLVCTLADAPVRMLIVLVAAFGFGIQEWMDTGIFYEGYVSFLWTAFWSTFILSPWLWACFGLGAFVGYKAGG